MFVPVICIQNANNISLHYAKIIPSLVITSPLMNVDIIICNSKLLQLASYLAIANTSGTQNVKDIYSYVYS